MKCIIFIFRNNLFADESNVLTKIKEINHNKKNYVIFWESFKNVFNLSKFITEKYNTHINSIEREAV